MRECLLYHNENLFSFNNKQIVASQVLHSTQTLRNVTDIFKKSVTIFKGKMQQYMILHVSWHFLISQNFTYTRNYKICQSLKLKIWAYLKEHKIFPHFNYMNRNCYDWNIFYIYKLNVKFLRGYQITIARGSWWASFTDI